MRLLLVGHQFQVPSEGQAKAAAIAALEGFDVHVLTPDRYREGGVAWRSPAVPSSAAYQFHVAKVRLPWAGPAQGYLQSYRDVGAILARLRPHIIDVWEEPWNLLSAQICHARARLLPSAKLISETEQNVAKQLPFPFERFRRYTFECADFLVGRNAEALSVARSKGYAGPAAVVGNGVDVSHFTPSQSRLTRGQAGERASGPFDLSGVRSIGYAGRLVPEKGLDTLLAALAVLGQRCRLRICGDGPLRERLLREPGVEWVGNLPREKLLSFYRSLDALVLPSRTTPRWKEQFGRVLIEAQACGIPVIGSSSGAIPEVIGDAGVVFPEGDAGALASGLARLLGDGRLWLGYSQAGRARVKELYSWQAIAMQMGRIYRSLRADLVSGLGDPVQSKRG